MPGLGILGRTNQAEDSLRSDITSKLIVRFKELIVEGILLPGCKLPPERELAERFGVARASLRQALKVMEIMGVIHQRVGDGTYLRSNASAILNEPMDFLVLLDSISHHELFEARLIVEPELAARAAERATTADLAELRRSIAALERGASDATKVVDADLAFHGALFRAAGNRVCELMFRLIHRMMLNSIAKTSQLVQARHTVSMHGAIYSAIAQRQPIEAYERMVEHLNDARAVMMRAGSGSEVAANRIAPLKRIIAKRSDSE